MLEYFHAEFLLSNFPAFQNGRGSTEFSFEMMATIYLSQAGSETGLLSINAKMHLVEIYSFCPDCKPDQFWSGVEVDLRRM